MAATEILGSYFEYDHIQIYVREARDVSDYKQMEETLNEFEEALLACGSPEEDRAAWLRVSGEEPITEYRQTDQDVVEQLLHAIKMRVAGYRSNEGEGTKSFILQSHAEQHGVKVIVSALTDPNSKPSLDKEHGPIFSRDRIDRFLSLRNNREGFAVLGFRSKRAGTLDALLQKYEKTNPNLIASEGILEFENGGRVLETYAYYERDSTNADCGTVLRFFEGCENLPGFTPLDTSFPKIAKNIYFDHWVSNVHNRNQFIKTLTETLGFEPKVDFNAGVVAAGAAIIESTVVGNNPAGKVGDPLCSQSQLYLPINNALSEVGHVNGYLQEIGQGVQHIANRVENLIDLINKANRHRKATGHGFEFLTIPRSYYGVCDPEYLQCDQNVIEILTKSGICNVIGAVKLDVTDAEIESALGDLSNPEMTIRIKQSIYRNMKNLLGDTLSEEQYMAIVRNQVLVDMQGRDVLMQIFTARICFHDMKNEAPFMEYICRVCDATSADGPRPGCGGFGIRNFLTLFLSIELSKAMQEKTKAKSPALKEYWGKMVDIFTHQLNVSNPVLTRISDFMTQEADAETEEGKEIARKGKEAANDELKQISDEHKAAVENLIKPDI